jgi:hypothetical protein
MCSLISPHAADAASSRAEALAIGEGRDALYLDLEERDDRNRLANPALFLAAAEDRLVILDEIHRVPELFDTLRGVIDRGRRRQKGKGRFLILGSASIDLLRQSGESLAGRIAYIELTTLTALEIPGDRAARERLWLRGGFPDPYLADSDADSLAAAPGLHSHLPGARRAAVRAAYPGGDAGAALDHARASAGWAAQRLARRSRTSGRRGPCWCTPAMIVTPSPNRSRPLGCACWPRNWRARASQRAASDRRGQPPPPRLMRISVESNARVPSRRLSVAMRWVGKVT